MFILFGAEIKVSSSSTQLVHHTNLQWCLDSDCFRDSCPLRDWPNLPGNRDLSLRKRSLSRIRNHNSSKYGRAFVLPLCISILPSHGCLPPSACLLVKNMSDTECYFDNDSLCSYDLGQVWLDSRATFPKLSSPYQGRNPDRPHPGQPRE